jgi:hypothetical protein
MDTLRELVLEVYDRIIGLELADVGGRGWLHHQSPLRGGEKAGRRARWIGENKASNAPQRWMRGASP